MHCSQASRPRVRRTTSAFVYVGWQPLPSLTVQTEPGARGQTAGRTSTAATPRVYQRLGRYALTNLQVSWQPVKNAEIVPRRGQPVRSQLPARPGLPGTGSLDVHQGALQLLKRSHPPQQQRAFRGNRAAGMRAASFSACPAVPEDGLLDAAGAAIVQQRDVTELLGLGYGPTAAACASGLGTVRAVGNDGRPAHYQGRAAADPKRHRCVPACHRIATGSESTWQVLQARPGRKVDGLSLRCRRAGQCGAGTGSFALEGEYCLQEFNHRTLPVFHPAVRRGTQPA